MAEALDRLTEKERETLRLIVRGHDAKSAARELALSVHTINERLRAARRKLDVTSSREAARVLFESEGGPYENLAYEALGDAEFNAPSNTPPVPQRARNRAIWIGGIVMLGISALMLAMAMQPAPEDARKTEADLNAYLARPDAAKAETALEWLALVDRSDWQASYDAAGKSFQDLNTVATWRAASQQARVPLGAVVRREVIATEFVAAPPHGYTVVRFLSVFENRDAVIETVTMEREGDALKVVGYLID